MPTCRRLWTATPLSSIGRSNSRNPGPRQNANPRVTNPVPWSINDASSSQVPKLRTSKPEVPPSIAASDDPKPEEEGAEDDAVDEGAVTRDPLWLWPKPLLPCAAASAGYAS